MKADKVHSEWHIFNDARYGLHVNKKTVLYSQLRLFINKGIMKGLFKWKVFLELMIQFDALIEYASSKLSPDSYILSEDNLLKKSVSKQASSLLDASQKHFIENRAAIRIQRFWRTFRAKEALVNDSYHFYLSLLGSEEKNRQLSSIMYGRHIAELALTNPERSKNILLDPDMHYHRTDYSQPFKLSAYLFNEFTIPERDREKNRYFIVSLLKNITIDAFIEEHAETKFPTRLIRRGNRPIGVLEVINEGTGLASLAYSNEIHRKLNALGLMASPWEIALNISPGVLSIEPAAHINWASHLPETKTQLLESRGFQSLNKLASSQCFPTQKLASCLNRIIHNLPLSDQSAIRRIALILEIANVFYKNNYPRYSLCVYTIIHEVSLALLVEGQENFFDELHRAFFNEAKEALLVALKLSDSQIENSFFIASTAISGTNAFAQAINLAKKMHTASGLAPTMKVIHPNYHEFYPITEKLNQENPDVFIISAGPILKADGLAPGVDINHFVKRNIIDRACTKPITLLIDTTTALYKNLNLVDEVKALIQQGRLSIIIHESHQKFGLLHSDQTQYGRMFALCAKNLFADALVEEIGEKSRLDFHEHIDLRIGAFISTSCGAIIEEIKEQHFRNGALFGRPAKMYILEHESNLTNPDEYYFFCTFDPEFRVVAKSFLDRRDSFGHYSTTHAPVGGQTRLSFDASDEIDSLMQYMYLKLGMQAKVEWLKQVVIHNAEVQEVLSLEEQMLSLAIINCIIKQDPLLTEARDINKKMGLEDIEFSLALDNFLGHCQLLKGRDFYSKAQRALTLLRKNISETNEIKHPQRFFKALKIIYDYNIVLSTDILSRLTTNETFLQFIIREGNSSSGREAIAEWVINPDRRIPNVKRVRPGEIGFFCEPPASAASSSSEYIPRWIG